MRVLLEDGAFPFEEAAGHSLMKDIREQGFTGSVEIRTVSDALRQTYDYHMMVADPASYRYQRDRKVVDGVVVFGSPDKTGRLSRIFDGLWGECLART